MNKFTKINSDNIQQTIEFLSRLSELVKCTLGGFSLIYDQSKFISMKNFSFRFSLFLPKNCNNIDNINYKKIFIGKKQSSLIMIYQQLLKIFIQESEFRIPPTNEPPVGYSLIEKEFRKVDKAIDQELQSYVK